ncbi:serine-enriched protein-like [Liolophura sinensis]|uniref:serine-enriched protein-like n=1 Tax=Liolophura sinensis TaxID=3198878 RepID=UPI0031585AA7
MDSGVFVHSWNDANVVSIQEDSASETSSLGSSILFNDHLLQTPVRIHADSMDSLNETSTQANEQLLIFKNTTGLQNDLRSILDLPDICDMEFIVGEKKVPVYGVKAIIAARNQAFFHKIQYDMTVARRRSKMKKARRMMSQFRKIRKHQSRTETWINRLNVPIEDFEPEAFRPLIVYLHCGCLTVSGDTVVGVMNAADTYGFDQVREVCFTFAESLITKDCVLPLLVSTEKYSSFKMSKLLLLKIMGFVREHAQDVLQSPCFPLVPLQTALLVLSHNDLNATEDSKCKSALAWSRHYCQMNENRSVRVSMAAFLPYIDFAGVEDDTLREMYSLDVVAEDVLDSARRHQVRPRVVIGQDAPAKLSRKKSFRRSTKQLSAFIRRKCASVTQSPNNAGDSRIASVLGEASPGNGRR